MQWGYRAIDNVSHGEYACLHDYASSLTNHPTMYEVSTIFAPSVQYPFHILFHICTNILSTRSSSFSGVSREMTPCPSPQHHLICLPITPAPETDTNANTSSLSHLSHLSQAHSITHACTQPRTHTKDWSSKNTPTNHLVLTVCAPATNDKGHLSNQEIAECMVD
jgi:hypothetical protein